MKTFRTRAGDLEENIPSDCWFEYSVCVKVKEGNRQNDGNSRRKTEEGKVDLHGEKLGGERENDSLKIQKRRGLQRGYSAHRGTC